MVVRMLAGCPMPAFAQPVASAFDGENVGVVDDPVDHRGGEVLVSQTPPQPENWFAASCLKGGWPTSSTMIGP